MHTVALLWREIEIMKIVVVHVKSLMLMLKLKQKHCTLALIYANYELKISRYSEMKNHVGFLIHTS